MGIIEPFDLSKEERQKFHELLDRLTEAIEQPKLRPALRLLPSSNSGVIIKTPEFEGDTMTCDQEDLKAIALDLLAAARDAVIVLNWLIGNVPPPHGRLRCMTSQRGWRLLEQQLSELRHEER